nr:MAG TPA_asm: hypothetical protein [Bacteriophage sp.]
MSDRNRLAGNWRMSCENKNSYKCCAVSAP